HAHEFGQRGNRHHILVANCDQHSQLGGAKSDRAQIVVIKPGHGTRCHSRPVAETDVLVQLLAPSAEFACRAYTQLVKKVSRGSPYRQSACRNSIAVRLRHLGDQDNSRVSGRAPSTWQAACRRWKKGLTCNRACARSRAIAAKAASISAGVLALK